MLSIFISIIFLFLNFFSQSFSILDRIYDWAQLWTLWLCYLLCSHFIQSAINIKLNRNKKMRMKKRKKKKNCCMNFCFSLFLSCCFSTLWTSKSERINWVHVCVYGQWAAYGTSWCAYISLQRHSDAIIVINKPQLSEWNSVCRAHDRFACCFCFHFTCVRIVPLSFISSLVFPVYLRLSFFHLFYLFIVFFFEESYEETKICVCTLKNCRESKQIKRKLRFKWKFR